MSNDKDFDVSYYANLHRGKEWVPYSDRPKEMRVKKLKNSPSSPNKVIRAPLPAEPKEHEAINISNHTLQIFPNQQHQFSPVLLRANPGEAEATGRKDPEIEEEANENAEEKN